MKSKVLLWVSLLSALPSFAAESGSGTAKPKEPSAAAPSTSGGPKVTGTFRIVKQDGNTVIQQAAVSDGSTGISTLTVAGSDAFISGSGHCAFNVKYDEISAVAANNTTNRLYSNDTLIAQNTKIDLQANLLKTIWTQPYLVPGMNNVRLVINADSAKPSTGWVRVNVTGSCGGVTATPTPPPPKTEPPKPTPPPTPKYGPGSAQWNSLYTAWGYSNYAVTQLKGKGYARYADLVKLNVELKAVMDANSVDLPTFNGLLLRWNAFLGDTAFKAAMAAIVASTAGHK
jgi:hypothetical protein